MLSFPREGFSELSLMRHEKRLQYNRLYHHQQYPFSVRGDSRHLKKVRGERWTHENLRTPMRLEFQMMTCLSAAPDANFFPSLEYERQAT